MALQAKNKEARPAKKGTAAKRREMKEERGEKELDKMA
jgi:hypothetical protein